jgi:hypothetical protein
MSSSETQPWDYPAWHGFARETALATQLICSAANSIGRASYASLGDYYMALFGFSNGIERLAKLILAADHVWTSGSVPRESELRAFGHGLPRLIEEVQAIEKRQGLEPRYEYPEDAITTAVIETLDHFADASRGRYANLATIVGKVVDNDPVANWWNTVIEPILSRHYTGTRYENRDLGMASWAENSFGDLSVVLHTDEVGDIITDVASASMRSSKSLIAQRYGRFYVLRLVRWMSNIYGDLVWSGAYKRRIVILFGHEERVSTFRVPNEFLLKRKRWPLR